MEVVAFLAALLFFGIGWVTSCDSEQTKTMFISSHTDKPFCIDESATVMGKTVHNKRCWKVVEVDP